MWMVRYAKQASVRQSTLYVPRARLPTDEECAALFDLRERDCCLPAR